MPNLVKFNQQISHSARERCSQLLEDIQAQFNMTLTVRDELGILRTPNGEALLKQRSYHIHPYCLSERISTPKFDKRCIEHCSVTVSKRCHVDDSPYVSCCWKGMQEVIVPIWRDGQHMITIFAGGYRDPKQKNAPGKEYSAEIRKAYQALPLYNDTQARQLTRLLYSVGLGLLQEVDKLRNANSSNTGRKQQIEKFIYNNAHQCCTLKKLAEYLFISSSRCSQVVKDLFGQSFQDLVIQERIERASHLLRTTGLNQETISTQCGFNNHFYFNRLFKKVTGIAPGEFRRRRKKTQPDSGR